MNFDIMQFIMPALLVLIPFLYFIGAALKKSQSVPDKNIPITLGIIGSLLALIFVLGTTENLNMQGALLAAFTAIVQGWLCAGMSVYVNQVIKQTKKEE